MYFIIVFILFVMTAVLIYYVFFKKLGNYTDGMEVDESKVRVPSIYWIPIVLCIAMLFIADVFQMQYFTLQFSKPIFSNVSFDDRAFTIYTPGCKIPYMDPFDAHIKPFLETPKPAKCNKGKPALFTTNLTAVYLVQSSLSSYQLNDTTSLNCCYAPFRRREPGKGESDDKFKLEPKCKSFSESAIITDEFIQVTCRVDNTTIYKDTFAFVPIKTNFTTNDITPKPINVLVIGLDAVSRLNLHRQMPKTVKYLKEQKAVELLGYNKVGDNTFPNLIPVLTGSYESQLVKTCWPKTSERFDNCTFIWNRYKKEGYATSFGEDSSWMGLFNYMRRGFRKQPTDYAYGYFNRYSENLIGNSHNMNVYECEGARLIFKDFLDYISRFVTTMTSNNIPYFGFFWGASLSHDYLNKPKLGDQYYYSFFKDLKDRGYLNNTAVFFISDHGIRWGSIRQTFQGRMEERLPFVHALIPESFQKRYPTAFKNLQQNSKRLTTPFDLHDTFLDLLEPSKRLSLQSNKSSRAVSLFKPISKERTCKDAEIASHWCTCQQSTEVNTNDTMVEKVAQAAVLHINKLLEGYAQCAKLVLDDVLNSRVMTHSSEIKGSNMMKDYLITIRTLPGEAVFEVTVRYTEKTKTFEVIGTISRLNLYGKQSACITDFHLKLYCYCRNML
ncbi:uncharacterized protein LOC114326035 isoform X1 [Diabrotica virgifera virgifera]|uniref:Uncharacterized protein LOC114326035 isoform X1 n=2 Tax=Diabrotica virgifera virgifera TaxID=50390 RepID=A0A6P7F8P3_DIAVI|nr:uncharacterized protein LOC114326035 isoform X1 [Diabrotica virgifera virgifera]